MRKETPQPISNVLKDVVEKLSRAQQKGIAKILSSWGEVAGKDLSRHTRPISLKKGILLINVEDSPWFYQANLKKQKLLEGLQERIGEGKVQNIRFRIGSIKKK